jgi:hypothetical protein
MDPAPPEKTRILYAHDVRSTDTGDAPQEVVALPQHERIVDHVREQRDNHYGELEAVRRLLLAGPQESAVAAASKVAREREFETERIMRSPVVDEAPVHVCEGLCHAHGAFGPEGDCYVCDTQIANEARDRALKAFVLRYFELNPVEKADVPTIRRWLNGGPEGDFTTDEALEAINSLVDDDVIEFIPYKGINPAHMNEWALSSAERGRAIEQKRQIEGLVD